MLLPKDIHPYNSLYFNGAYVVKVLKEHGALEILDLFSVAKKELSSLTMPILVLTLDWLFLAGIVDLDEKGNLAICF